MVHFSTSASTCRGSTTTAWTRAHSKNNPFTTNGQACVGGSGRHGRRSCLCGVAAVDAQRQRTLDPIEETVENARVVLEESGPLLHGKFQEHQDASDICKQLEALSSSLDTVLRDTETIIEVNQWVGNTLPADVRRTYLETYRELRKKDKSQQKEDARLKREARQQRRLQRDAQTAAAAAADNDLVGMPLASLGGIRTGSSSLTVPPVAADVAEQPRLQQHVIQQETTATDGVHVPQQLGHLVPETVNKRSRSSSRAQQQVLQQEAQQPLQQADRQRRRRNSTAVPAAVPAVAAPSAATPVASSPMSVSAAPAALSSMDISNTISATSSSHSSQGSRGRLQPAAAAAAGAFAAEPVTVNRGGPAGPRPAVVADSVVIAAVPALISRPGSSSGQGRALPPPLQLGSSLSGSHSAPARSGSRRTMRASGMDSRGARAAVQAAAVAPASKKAMKLADNNVNGLDMRSELLTSEQERDLSLMVQDLLQLEAVQQQLAVQLGRPPSDQEWMEAAGAAPAEGIDGAAAVMAFSSRLQHARQAKQAMISANYKLVVSICKKYQGYGMTMGDLINEGIAGLVKGVERFEPSKGFKFSTYAHWWIRQSVTRSLTEQGRLVRLPSHLQEMMTKMTKVSRAYEAQYGREASLAELAKELGVDPERIQDAYEAVFTPRSLDQPMGDAEGATLGDLVEDDRAMGAEDVVFVESLKHDLEGVLANLPARDAGVVRMRFGLADGHERTLDEIGEKFNVTRERIRQIEAKAIRQLRARQVQAGSILADYQAGDYESKAVAARTSSGTRKQA